jgi:GT2 family glycosyltransferase
MSEVILILVNYGNWEDTIECYESILKNSFRDYAVFTVDVANKNNSYKHLSDWHDSRSEQFILLKTDENKGFAFANNIALKYIREHALTKYVWILNNDTVIEKDALSELYDFHKQKEEKGKTGFIGSKISEYENRDIIQSVGGYFNERSGYSILIGKGEKDTGQYDSKELKPDYVIGASMFFHIDLLNDIDFMPEDYFLYYEDIDWCITAKKKGYTNHTCTKSIVYHKQGKSTGNKYSKKTAYTELRRYMYVSYLKFFRKQYRSRMYIAYFILFKQYTGRIFRLQFKEAFVILKVIFGIIK